MASQEEVLRGVVADLAAVKAGVDTVLAQLADLKQANPALADEIDAIVKAVADLKAEVPAPPVPAG